MLEELTQALRDLGMMIRGGFLVSAELAEADGIPEISPGRPARALLLIGNAGAAMYRPFFAISGTKPAVDNPLDSWTRQALEPVADRMGARALFPFGAAPWFPFQRWASRAEGLKPSPLGVLIHPEFGLWHAYRAAFLFDREVRLPEVPNRPSPCDSCRDRPCLSACPAGAIGDNGYAVDVCAAHVRGDLGASCRDDGCLARRACPVGRGYIYPPAALRFHMAAFLAGRNASNTANSTPGDVS